SFPAFIIVAVIVAVGLFQLAGYATKKYNFTPNFASINRRRALMMVAGVAGVFIAVSIYFGIHGELGSYYKWTPFYAVPNALADIIAKKLPNIAGDSYVGGSREATSFMSQWNEVFRYYNAFVVPIGLGLLGLIMGLSCTVIQVIARLKNNSESSVETPLDSQPDRPMDKSTRSFVLLLGVWWVLDMLMAWVSPRSYVQYFLPLNGSGAMLGSYVIYRCLKNNAWFIALAAVWIVTHFLLIRLLPDFSLRDLAAVPGNWSLIVENYRANFYLRFIPLVLAVAGFFGLKHVKPTPVRPLVLTLLCGIMVLWFNTSNFSAYQAQASQVDSNQGWMQLAQQLKENSKPDDTLYVWGWFPGIYVHAERFTPARKPSYSDMHTDSPSVVYNKIRHLVQELEKSPPLYIIDSQKFHFPYYKHPNFELWPHWADAQKKGFHFYRYSGSAPGPFFKLSEWEQVRAFHFKAVESMTLALLKNAKVDPAVAAQLAERERLRHEVMAPLREFVMENYTPLSGGGGMVIFKRK
ncbi:MAG: hypothetical protein K9M57_09730, partial [Phycisphaerae bacterium]|nr:hypothetical protein [Phycisphaerae bacterium]